MFLVSCSAFLWRFQSLETDTPDENTTLKTYGKWSSFILLTLYQHLGSNGAKFFFLFNISTDHLNQAKSGRYKIK